MANCDCGFESRKSDHYCRSCGNELELTDSFLCECGAEVLLEDNFCHACGAGFEGIEDVDTMEEEDKNHECGTCGTLPPDIDIVHMDEDDSVNF